MANLRANKIVSTTGSNAITGSVEFDGTSDYLAITNSNEFDFDASMTIEAYVYFSDLTSSPVVFSRGGGNTSSSWSTTDGAQFAIYGTSTGRISFEYNSSGTPIQIISATGTLSANSWNHIAITYNGTTFTLYLNGINVGTASNAPTMPTTRSNIWIGMWPTSALVQDMKGFISNLRIVKGTALYTQNFIPPTAELKNIPGTVLLCCQNPSSATQEATGKTITVNGNTTARNFAPAVGSDGSIEFVGPTKINTENYFYLPTGNTEDRGRGRGVFGGGTASPGSSNLNSIEYITLQTLGNAIDFGDLSVATRTKGGGGVASYTRGITGGGFDSGNTNRIEYITFATTGNAIDFGGTLTTAGRNLASASNSVRGIFAGGYNRDTTIDYLTIASTGTVSSFGSLSSPGRGGISGLASQTRALFGGGYTTPASVNIVEYVTIASTGNAIDFGDLTVARTQSATCSNSIRGIFAGGATPTPTLFNTIDYVTIASTGNAQDFGDLIVVEFASAGTSSQTRGVFAGGASAYVNTIQYITISSTGNAQDFGDLIISRCQAFSCSDSHGGLG